MTATTIEARNPEASSQPTRIGLALGLATALCIGLTAPAASAAEPAWVDNEVRLNLRTGAGTGFRIVGAVSTGDRVEILSRENNWTQIRLQDGKRGWIPAGYLKSEAPPDVRLAEAEEELRKLRSQYENATLDVTRLRDSNDQISGREKEQTDEINRLTLENLDLKSGPRWPEWITGASILSVGMILGALLRGSSSRRPTPRIRL
jgi:SH3 domain protein